MNTKPKGKCDRRDEWGQQQERPRLLVHELQEMLGGSVRTAEGLASYQDVVSSPIDGFGTAPNGEKGQPPAQDDTHMAHELEVSASHLRRDLKALTVELQQAAEGINSQLALNARDLGVRFAGQNRQLSEILTLTQQLFTLQSEHASLREHIGRAISDLKSEFLTSSRDGDTAETSRTVAVSSGRYFPPELEALAVEHVRRSKLYESLFYGLVLMLLSVIAAMQIYELMGS